MNQKIFALVDCNNFFVSCERVFNPALHKRPVAVLSSNDGCVIARSNEAKALGIPMGAPAFKYKQLFKQHNVHVCSSNFELYGDMSWRVMRILEDLVPALEIYSIDEAFIDLSTMSLTQASAYAYRLRAIVQQWTGIPISVGIGTTKTLAKLANDMAKKHFKDVGIYNIALDKNSDAVFAAMDVASVWGIGRRYTVLLHEAGIKTVQHLQNVSDDWIRKKMSILGLKTVWELRGTACLQMHEDADPKKAIICSRSFGKPVTDINDLKEAVATYTSRAAEKMRNQNSCCLALMVFITTSRFAQGDDYYSTSKTIELPFATSYTPMLIHYALQAVEKMYRAGYAYKKAGVMVMELVSEDDVQLPLYASHGDRDKHAIMMKWLDHINDKWGDKTLQYAALGVNQTWKAQRVLRSPRYTTSWQELLVVRD